MKIALGWVLNGPLKEPKDACAETDGQQRGMMDDEIPEEFAEKWKKMAG